jgi:hypothetical protein
VREILKETLDGKTEFRLTFLRESFLQLIAEKATANFDVTNRLASKRAEFARVRLSPNHSPTQASATLTKP